MRYGFTIAAGLLLAASSLGGGAPAFAQAGGNVLTIYGRDKCPTDSNGEEIVVCRRLPEGERYRIPQNLRSTDDAAPTAAARVDAMEATTNATIGTCSASGPGGQTGCQLQAIRAARAERAQAAREVTIEP